MIRFHKSHHFIKVRGAMEIAVFIQNIQEERAEVALHIFSNQSRALTERFQMTDRALEEVPTWPNVRSKKTVTVHGNKKYVALHFRIFITLS